MPGRSVKLSGQLAERKFTSVFFTHPDTIQLLLKVKQCQLILILFCFYEYSCIHYLVDSIGEVKISCFLFMPKSPDVNSIDFSPEFCLTGHFSSVLVFVSLLLMSKNDETKQAIRHIKYSTHSFFQ